MRFSSTASITDTNSPSRFLDGIVARQTESSDAPRGLGDFQRRSNRDRGWGGRRDSGHSSDQNQRSWDSTPRNSDDAPSVRVPNVGWDATPRDSSGRGGGWGSAANRRWDATPRTSRGSSPEGDDYQGAVPDREWEEEQVRLDRDWYGGAEEGGVVCTFSSDPFSDVIEITLNPRLETMYTIWYLSTRT